MKHASNFIKKPKFLTLNVLRSPALPVTFFGNFASSSNFSKCQKNFPKNPSIFWKKSQISESFGISRKFIRVLQQHCNLYHFVKNAWFFYERHIYFSFKIPNFQLWTFWEFLLFQSLSSATLLALAIFQNVKFFFRKHHLSVEENPNFESFEKSYFFSRILQQICFL